MYLQLITFCFQFSRSTWSFEEWMPTTMAAAHYDAESTSSTVLTVLPDQLDTFLFCHRLLIKALSVLGGCLHRSPRFPCCLPTSSTTGQLTLDTWSHLPSWWTISTGMFLIWRGGGGGKAFSLGSVDTPWMGQSLKDRFLHTYIHGNGGPDLCGITPERSLYSSSWSRQTFGTPSSPGVPMIRYSRLLYLQQVSASDQNAALHVHFLAVCQLMGPSDGRLIVYHSSPAMCSQDSTQDRDSPIPPLNSSTHWLSQHALAISGVGPFVFSWKKVMLLWHMMELLSWFPP